MGCMFLFLLVELMHGYVTECKLFYQTPYKVRNERKKEKYCPF